MSKVIELSPTSQYQEIFNARRDTRSGEPDALLALREEALARFNEHGFPHRRVEEWKKTDLKRIKRTEYAAAPAPDKNTVQEARKVIDSLDVGPCAARFVFIDGFHVPELSSFEARAGFSCRSVAEALRSDGVQIGTISPGEPEDHGSLDAGPHWSLADLNLALFTDGLYLRLEQNVQLQEPVHMIHLTTGADTPLLVAPRHRVELAPFSEATLIETYAGLDHGGVFNNVVTEAHVEEGATLHHYKVQREPLSSDHISVTAANVDKSANLQDLSFSLGAGLSRHDIHGAIIGEGGHIDMNGVFLGRHEQHVDHRTTIVHAVPETTSREFYKGIMDDAAHGVFTGKIVVAKGAQHTDADQQNKNLILSRKGLVDTTPQLEIFADDVKCAHGSTIGQIDPHQLFYLQSRGIPRERARLILTQAFAHEPLELVPEGPLRDRFTALVTDWFIAGNPEAVQDTPTGEGSEKDAERRDPLVLVGAVGHAPRGKGKKQEHAKAGHK